MELELPLDLRGMSALWVHTRGRVRRVVSWHAPWSFEEDPLPPSLLSELDSSTRMRLLRLLSLDGAGHGPWLAQASGTSARLGRHRLTWELMMAWLRGEQPSPEDASVARSLLEVERRRVKSAMQWKREWPSGVIHLEDMPAWLVPPTLRHLRRMGRKGRIELISGGHLLHPGRWHWHVPAAAYQPSSVNIESNHVNNVTLVSSNGTVAAKGALSAP